MTLDFTRTDSTSQPAISATLARAIALQGNWDYSNRVDPDPAGDPPAPVATPPNAPPAPDPNSETAYATLQKEREQRKDFERRFKESESKLQAFKGIDPAEYAKAMEVAKAQQEWEAKQAQIEAEWEAKMQQKYEPQIAQMRQQLAEKDQEFQLFLLDQSLEREYGASGGFPGDYVYVGSDLRQRVHLVDGALTVMEPDGKTPAYIADKGQSRPKTVSELILDLQAERPGFARHFKNSDRPGFANVGGGTPVLAADATSDQIAKNLTAYRERKYG